MKEEIHKKYTFEVHDIENGIYLTGRDGLNLVMDLIKKANEIQFEKIKILSIGKMYNHPIELFDDYKQNYD